MLTRLAQQARLGEQDVIGLLRAYGRDVAGALQIWDPDIPGEPRQPSNSLERLFKLMVLSAAAGNLDMHAKNLSLLHPTDGSMTLSPAYDVVPQAHLPNDGEVGLAIGGEYRHAAITMAHLMAEGHAWGLSGAADLAEETLVLVRQLAGTETPHPRAYARLAKEITGFADNLLAGRAIGAGGRQP